MYKYSRAFSQSTLTTTKNTKSITCNNENSKGDRYSTVIIGTKKNNNFCVFKTGCLETQITESITTIYLSLIHI